MPSRDETRPSFAGVHHALEQLGYRLLAEYGGISYYQHQEHPEVIMILDFDGLITFDDLSRALSENGENPDAFFAMYEAL